MGPTLKMRQRVRRRRNLGDLMGHRNVDRKNLAPIVLCPHTSTRSNPFVQRTPSTSTGFPSFMAG